MPRRGFVAKRDVLPDPVYNSKKVTRLINNIMLDGKKGVAQRIVYGAFDIISEKTGKDPLEVFDQAMENVMPQLEVKAVRKGGATYQAVLGPCAYARRPEKTLTLPDELWSRNESWMRDFFEQETSDFLCLGVVSRRTYFGLVGGNSARG